MACFVAIDAADAKSGWLKLHNDVSLLDCQILHNSVCYRMRFLYGRIRVGMKWLCVAKCHKHAACGEGVWVDDVCVVGACGAVLGGDNDETYCVLGLDTVRVEPMLGSRCVRTGCVLLLLVTRVLRRV